MSVIGSLKEEVSRVPERIHLTRDADPAKAAEIR
jgi:hypothetical protein